MEKYLKYKNLYIPTGIDQNSKLNPVNADIYACRMLGKMHLVETCDGISCAKCICNGRNADIAADYFLGDRSRSSTAPSWVREFMGVKIPANIDEHYEATMRVRPNFKACTATDHDGHDCSSIFCSECILHKGNEDIARKYFNCLKQKENDEMSINNLNNNEVRIPHTDRVSEFMGLFIPDSVDENYIPSPPDALAPGWHECRRHETDTDRKLCSNMDIACSQCILGVCNSDVASKFFKNNNNKESKTVKIDTSKICLDDAIYTFTSFRTQGTECYYVVIRFSTNRDEADILLKDLPLPRTVLWVEDRKDASSCSIMIPYSLHRHARETRDAIRCALDRLSKKSEVDEFLAVTNACADGRKFAADCSSMSEVWVKAVQQRKTDYIEFMLRQVAYESEVAAKFHKSEVPMDVLIWAYQQLCNWDLDDLDVYLKFNPFKQKDD